MFLVFNGILFFRPVIEAVGRAVSLATLVSGSSAKRCQRPLTSLEETPHQGSSASACFRGLGGSSGATEIIAVQVRLDCMSICSSVVMLGLDSELIL